MAANEKTLGGLHEKLCTVLSTLLDGTDIPPELDEEGNVISPGANIPPSASVLTVVAKVLKDNNITCTPSKDNAIGELEEKMRARADRRKAARVTATDLRAAEDETPFMSGLPN